MYTKIGKSWLIIEYAKIRVGQYPHSVAILLKFERVNGIKSITHQLFWRNTEIGREAMREASHEKAWLLCLLEMRISTVV